MDSSPKVSVSGQTTAALCVSGPAPEGVLTVMALWEGSAYELNELQVQKSTARMVEYRVTVVTQNPGKLGTSAFQSHGVWMDHVGKEALGICGARARLVDRNGCGLYLQDEGLHVPLVQLGTLLLPSHCWFSPAAFRI